MALVLFSVYQEELVTARLVLVLLVAVSAMLVQHNVVMVLVVVVEPVVAVVARLMEVVAMVIVGMMVVPCSDGVVVQYENKIPDDQKIGRLGLVGW